VLQEVFVTSWTANLPAEAADRQARSALSALRERGVPAQLERVPLPASRSSGGAVFVRAQFENTAAGFTGLTERRASPEQAGKDAAEAFSTFMESAGALDEHLSDQILLPAGLLAAGKLGEATPGTTRFRPERVTDHLTTHADVLQAFLPVKVTIEADGQVTVAPR
jgi:RNA 3'-terminal phosphate cyclase (ATP)